MNKYESLIKRLKAMQELLEEMQDIVYLGQAIDAVDSFTFGKVVESYFKLSKQVEDLQKLVSAILLCKNDTDRLNFFLKNIYISDRFISEDLI